jgi:HSP90 family molecular chaperone
MEQMMKMYAPDMPMPRESVLILNVASPLISRLAEGGYGDKAPAVAKHVYMLATLSHRALDADEMNAFLKGSYEILGAL